MATRTHSSKPLPADTANVALMAVALLGLGYSLFVGWQTLNPPADTTGTASAAPTPTPAGTLKLNAPHQRQGPTVAPDTSLPAKSNPFQ